MKENYEVDVVEVERVPFWKRFTTAAAVGGTSLSCLVLGGLPVFAEGETPAAGTVDSTTMTAITNAFTNVQTSATGIINAAVPIALAIMGIVLAIRIGVKFFKGMAK